MERDFMGLSAKNSAAVKEEFVEASCEDSGFLRSSGVPWPLTETVSTHPNFMSLKPEQDDKPSRMNSDLLAPHGFMNFGGAKQQYLDGNPHSLPPVPYVAGTTERFTSKASGVPAQLTIFYGGTVSVFDGISPEKAQAIMLLAGTGCIQPAQPKLHMQAPGSKLPAADQALGNQTTPAGSGLPSPMSVSSHPVEQSGSPLANGSDMKISKMTGLSTTLVSRGEPHKGMPPIGSMSASAMISSAVPQARKASLARFLEKRKERVMSSAPYDMRTKAVDCATPESNGVGCSATSGVGSTSICQ